MENIINYLPPHLKKNTVCIFKGGSQLFCTNCGDTDYVVLTRGTPMYRVHRINELNTDLFLFSLSAFKRMLIDDKWRYKLCACLAYCNSENVVYGELPQLEIDIFSSEYMRKILAIEYSYAQKTYFAKYPLKSMVWGLALYYVIVNNSFEFTDEQKLILQQAHDLELDVSYRDELKLNMESILYS